MSAQLRGNCRSLTRVCITHHASWYLWCNWLLHVSMAGLPARNLTLPKLTRPIGLVFTLKPKPGPKRGAPHHPLKHDVGWTADQLATSWYSTKLSKALNQTGRLKIHDENLHWCFRSDPFGINQKTRPSLQHQRLEGNGYAIQIYTNHIESIHISYIDTHINKLLKHPLPASLP